MAGLLDKPAAVSHLEPLAFFNHPEILDVQRQLFAVTTRPRAVTNRVQAIKERLKDAIYEFIEKFEIDVLIPQNILAIPMHIPLGLAMTEVIAETGIATIAHHHDFTWERERFTISSGADYLAAAFSANAAEHGARRHQLDAAKRARAPLRPGLDGHPERDRLRDAGRPHRRLHTAISAARSASREDDILVLQPTRIVARKGIEHSIELLRRLKDKRCKLVFSHPPGDEGDAYFRLIEERIADAGIEARYIWDQVG